MRLINTSTLDLEESHGDSIPKYAILSHTWRDQEVSYHGWQQVRTRRQKKGFRKIQSACMLAAQHSLQYLWVDTNCINKESSAELTEAINSMYMWYRNSSICFAYIDDYAHHSSDQSLDTLPNARWFTRGWTLQELLAPSEVKFYDASWKFFGTKTTLLRRLSTITSIQHQYLMSPSCIPQASISRRMSWISQRSTDREEDMAYCLLGLFDINMPLLYGEGSKAFIRLQEEIIKYSNDHTIFCWEWEALGESKLQSGWYGCLSPSPSLFRNGSDVIEARLKNHGNVPEYQLTNAGLRISLSLLDCFNSRGCKLAVLNARRLHPSQGSQLCLMLQETTRDGQFARSAIDTRLMQMPTSCVTGGGSSIYIVHEREPRRSFTDIRIKHTTYGASRGSSVYAIIPVASVDNSGSVLLLEGGTKTFFQHPTVNLHMTDNRDLYIAEDKIKVSDDSEISILFKVQIGGPEVEDWMVEITLRGTKLSGMGELVTTQKRTALKTSELRSGTGDAIQLARAVFVSFQEYLRLLKDSDSQSVNLE